MQVTFVPSKAARALQAGLALLIALACAFWLAPWWGAVVLGLLLPQALKSGARVPPPLRLVATGWECWQGPRRVGAATGREGWRPVGLRLDRLGPHVIELRLDGRRYAIWFDAAPDESLRQLRLALMSPQPGGSSAALPEPLSEPSSSDRSRRPPTR